MFMTSKSSSYWGQKRGKGIEPQKAGCSLLRWMVASTSGWGGFPSLFLPRGAAPETHNWLLGTVPGALAQVGYPWWQGDVKGTLGCGLDCVRERP